MSTGNTSTQTCREHQTLHSQTANVAVTSLIRRRANDDMYWNTAYHTQVTPVHKLQHGNVSAVPTHTVSKQ